MRLKWSGHTFVAVQEALAAGKRIGECISGNRQMWVEQKQSAAALLLADLNNLKEQYPFIAGCRADNWKAYRDFMDGWTVNADELAPETDTGIMTLR